MHIGTRHLALATVSLALAGCGDTRVNLAFKHDPAPTKFVQPTAPAVVADTSTTTTTTTTAALGPPTPLAPPQAASSPLPPASPIIPAPAVATNATPVATTPATPAASTTAAAAIAPAAAPAPADESFVPPEPAKTPEPSIWVAEKGATYRDTLDRWLVTAGMQPAVYDFPDPDDDWQFDAQLIVKGTIKEAIKELSNSVHAKQRPVPFLFRDQLVVKEQL